MLSWTRVTSEGWPIHNPDPSNCGSWRQHHSWVGVIIAPHAVLTSDVVLGKSVYVGLHSSLSHDNRIGDWCQISGECAFGGGVIVEEECFFGIGAVVVTLIHIGKNAFVGVGSVVLRKVRPGTKVFGNPAVAI
jgi:acetyltransferase-like isoleucine patch superfamily enzyme